MMHFGKAFVLVQTSGGELNGSEEVVAVA